MDPTLAQDIWLNQLRTWMQWQEGLVHIVVNENYYFYYKVKFYCF